MSALSHLFQQTYLTCRAQPWLVLGLLLTIPAFYLELDARHPNMWAWGRGLYFCAALFLSLSVLKKLRHARTRKQFGLLSLDLGIFVGCVSSAWYFAGVWGWFDWLLRLSLCAAIVLRLVALVLREVRLGRLMQMTLLALLLLACAGAGFYWLEPSVQSYADGIWLAFTTIATVGYGDIVPSTPAAKIFAVFIVLLGYAVFSLVTANIAALFVEEDEKKLERELHADIRKLSREVELLRQELLVRDRRSQPSE